MKHTLKFKESIDISAGRLNTWANFNMFQQIHYVSLCFTKRITPQGFDFKIFQVSKSWTRTRLRLRLAIALQSLWNTGNPWRWRATTLVKVQQKWTTVSRCLSQVLPSDTRVNSLTATLCWNWDPVCRFDADDLGRCLLSEYETWSTGKEKNTYIEYHRITELSFACKACRFTTRYHRAQMMFG